MGLGLAFLRAVVGGLFMGHGLQKLAGWFGGGGLKGTGEFFEQIEMKPGAAHAAAAGVAETAGGAMVAAGLATPVGASLLTGTMLTAIRKVHASNGVWVSDNGYEYNLVLIAVLFALSDLGPGRCSLDRARGRERAGLRWALGELAVGAIGSAAAVALGARGRSAADDSAEGRQRPPGEPPRAVPDTGSAPAAAAT
jgi:putative oxidoreductase